MKEKKLDQTFYDSSIIKLDIDIKNLKIQIELKDSRNTEYTLYFNKLRKLTFEYPNEKNWDDLTGIAEIKKVQENQGKKIFNILFAMEEAQMKIVCEKFDYKKNRK